MLTPIGGGHCKVNYHFCPVPEFSQPRMEHTRAELVFNLFPYPRAELLLFRATG